VHTAHRRLPVALSGAGVSKLEPSPVESDRMALVLLFILLLVVVGIAYLAAGYADPEVSRRCPDCGLQELSIVYPGHVQVVSRFHCEACGADYRESPEGTLVREE